MNLGIYTIADHFRLAKDIYKLTLLGDTSAFTAPGQFVNIKIDGFYLRRPMSVHHYDKNTFSVIYKVVGDGTRALSRLERGSTLDLLTGLGNGFDSSKSGEKPVLIGGGSGIPPLYQLCLQLKNEGKKPSVILGFNTEADMFCIDEFARIAYEVRVCTADGSFGESGFVTDVLKTMTDYTYFYACGPEAMLHAVYDSTAVSGQLSFEERMGCGFGACMGCSCKTKYGNKRICVDGPVLEKEEIIW